MATDKKPVQNQNVFIKLDSVITLTNEYNRTVENYTSACAHNHGSIGTWAARKQALEYAIETLGLPIPRR